MTSSHSEGQAASLVEMSIADLSAGQRIGGDQAVAEELRKHKGGGDTDAKDQADAVDRANEQATARGMVNAIERAVRAHRWSCVIKDGGGGKLSTTPTELVPSQITNGRGTRRRVDVDQEGAGGALSVVLLTTVGPWSVGGYTVYLGNPQNAPDSCRQHRFAGTSSVHVRENAGHVVFQGQFKRIAVQFDPHSHSGLAATITAPSSSTHRNRSTVVKFTTHEYQTYAQENIFGLTGSGSCSPYNCIEQYVTLTT